MKSKKINTLVTLSFALLLLSCKKDHTCYCSSKYADIGGFTIHGTKEYAKQKCKEIYKELKQTELNRIREYG